MVGRKKSKKAPKIDHNVNIKQVQQGKGTTEKRTTEKRTTEKRKTEKHKIEKRSLLKDDYPIAASFSNNIGLLIKALFGSIALFTFALLGLYYMMSQKIEGIETKVFVVKESKAYSAEILSDQESRIVIDKAEVVSHLKTFIYNMFSYNKINFDDRVATALELVSPSDGKVLFDALEKSNTKKRLIATGQSTEVQIDSILVVPEIGVQNVFNGEIYYFVNTYYEGNSVSDGHKIKCKITKTKRSVENPHGLMIDKINYFAYKPE